MDDRLPFNFMTDRVLRAAKAFQVTRAEQPAAMPDGDISDLAKSILKDRVGLSLTSDTATITMTPESFLDCIRSALKAAATRKDGVT